MKIFQPVLFREVIVAYVVAIALVATLLLPQLMWADESSSGGCGSAQDNDCDGSLNCSSASACSTGASGVTVYNADVYDPDDNNSTVGSDDIPRPQPRPS
jgi:hypothetical protein